MITLEGSEDDVQGEVVGELLTTVEVNPDLLDERSLWASQAATSRATEGLPSNIIVRATHCLYKVIGTEKSQPKSLARMRIVLVQEKTT